MSRAFVAMDGDKEPHGWVHASLVIGIAPPVVNYTQRI
jgi:hypothetical protein